MLQCRDDFPGGKILGVYEPVDTHRAHGGLVGRVHKSVVRHARHGALGAQALGYAAGHDIARLVGRDSHKEIGPSCAGLAQGIERCGLAGHGEQIVVGVEARQALAVFVEHYDVLLLGAEQAGQV